MDLVRVKYHYNNLMNFGNMNLLQNIKTFLDNIDLYEMKKFRHMIIIDLKGFINP